MGTGFIFSKSFFSSFSYFKTNGYKIFRHDWNKCGRGFLWYANEELPGKILNQTEIENK